MSDPVESRPAWEAYVRWRIHLDDLDARDWEAFKAGWDSCHRDESEPKLTPQQIKANEERDRLWGTRPDHASEIARIGREIGRQ